jgi:hypothetical protein
VLIVPFGAAGVFVGIGLTFLLAYACRFVRAAAMGAAGVSRCASSAFSP